MSVRGEWVGVHGGGARVEGEDRRCWPAERSGSGDRVVSVNSANLEPDA